MRAGSGPTARSGLRPQPRGGKAVGEPGRAKLERAILLGTMLDNSDLTGCRTCSISVWDLNLDTTKQLERVITRGGEPGIAADNYATKISSIEAIIRRRRN